jgi:hypothetical protein
MRRSVAPPERSALKPAVSDDEPDTTDSDATSEAALAHEIHITAENGSISAPRVNDSPRAWRVVRTKKGRKVKDPKLEAGKRAAAIPPHLPGRCAKSFSQFRMCGRVVVEPCTGWGVMS